METLFHFISVSLATIERRRLKPGIAIFVASLLTLAGCHSAKKKPAAPAPTTAPDLQVNWTTQAIPVPAAPVLPVKEGPSPLIYLVESATIVRITDTSSGEELLRMPMGARTIVSVNQETGVRVGSAIMKKGPLADGHRYAIFLESNERNTIRSGSIRPGATTRGGGR